MPQLKELASAIRSKNASPFVTTLDVFFDEADNYERVKKSGILTVNFIAELYRIPEDEVLGIWFVDLCTGIKISYLKPWPSHDLLSGDLYGAQQNAPLLDIEIP